jgi:hypothetical protein
MYECFNCDNCVIVAKMGPPEYRENNRMIRNIRDLARAVKFQSQPKYKHPANEYECNVYQLANAYLAEHPADDDEPISFEWLEAGESEWETMSSGDHGYYRLHELSYAIYQLDYAMSSNEVWVMFTHRREFERLATGIKTRGQLRRLIAALKGE